MLDQPLKHKFCKGSYCFYQNHTNSGTSGVSPKTSFAMDVIARQLCKVCHYIYRFYDPFRDLS